MPLRPNVVDEVIAFCAVEVKSYEHHILSNHNETYREYPPLMTWLKFGVKGQGHSRLSNWQRHPRRCYSIEVLSFSYCKYCTAAVWNYLPDYVSVQNSMSQRKLLLY